MLKRIKVGELIKAGKAHSQTGPFGTQLKASDYVEEGIPVINVRNIGFGDIRKAQLEFVDKEMAAKLNSHRLQKHDIVFGRKGAVERHSLIGESECGWVQGSDCIRLRILTDEYNPIFLSFFFRTTQHQQWMINLGSFGATMGSLNQEIISKIEIPDIPRHTQDKIASILSAYDELIAINNDRITLLDQIAEEIYKEWFVRLRFPGYRNTPIVDGLPEGWEKVKLRDCIEHYIGGGWGDEEPTGKNQLPAYVIRGTDIPDFRLGQLNFEILRYHSASNLNNRRLEENDIIFEVSGGTESQSLGRTAFIQKETLERFNHHVICASFCKLIRVNKAFISSYYINSLLNRLYKTGELMVYQVQSTGICNYRFEDFINAQSILKPSIGIQQKFDTLVAPMLKEIQILGTKNENLKQTLDLLLPRLISGKLSVEHLIKVEEEHLQLF